MSGRFYIVVSAQCHVARNGNSDSLELFHDPDGHRVVERENRVGHRLARFKELPRGASAAFDRETAAPDQPLVQRKAELGECLAATQKTLFGIKVSRRAGQNGDPPMSLLEHMFDHGLRAPDVLPAPG